MCGIAGFCGPAKRLGIGGLRAMLRAIHHRGPDASGVFTVPASDTAGACVYLGSARLAIQDLSSAGHQPMVEKRSGNAIAFNGEIYNFKELRAALERQGDVFRSSCDTEVALKSWSRAGVQAIRNWRGMFGAALWDHRRQELSLVRDRWGIKPLYYFWDGQCFAFCSEVRGLLASGLVPRKLEWRGVKDYLRFGSVQDPATMIEGVYALLPGHEVRWSKGRIACSRFATPFGEPPDERFDLESVLTAVVRQQLTSDVPVTVFLSGGVDSSVVAMLARQEAGPSVNTMSLVFEERNFSEGPYARAVAKFIGTRHHQVLLRPEQICEKALAAIARMDQPTSDGVNSYVICEAAKAAGFKVALSGVGGDEFFGGYATFRRTPRLAHMLHWCRKAPSLARLGARASAPAFRLMPGGPRKFAQYLRCADFNEHPLFLQRTVFFPDQVSRLCPFAASSSADTAADQYSRQLLAETSQLDAPNQISYLEARTYMANTLLRDCDQMSMAHSLELRVPLIDHELTAYLFKLSGESKGLGRTPKLLLRRTFEHKLPRDVFTRKKMGFTLPFALWLRTPLRDEVEHTLVSGEFLPASATRSIWREFEAGKTDWSRPWALYVLTRWIRNHIPDFAEQTESTSSAQDLDSVPAPISQ
jgi:asparagine synthase (glutamine-hydrolysing)